MIGMGEFLYLVGFRSVIAAASLKQLHRDCAQIEQIDKFPQRYRCGLIEAYNKR